MADLDKYLSHDVEPLYETYEETDDQIDNDSEPTRPVIENYDCSDSESECDDEDCGEYNPYMICDSNFEYIQDTCDNFLYETINCAVTKEHEAVKI